MDADDYLLVLVVDDVPATCRALRQLIEGEGHKAIEAQTAQWAIDLLRSHPFDLAIVDWNLGHPMSGSTVLRYALKRGVPVFMTSGYSKDFILAQWASQNPLEGMLDFLPKPVELEDRDGEDGQREWGLRSLLARVVRSKEDTPPQGTRLP